MIKLPSVTVSKVSTLADKSIRIQLDTPELPAQQMAGLFTAYLQGQQGVEIEEVMVKGKSPSERLRAVLYRLWETTKREQDFDSFYKLYMDQLINRIKDKL